MFLLAILFAPPAFYFAVAIWCAYEDRYRGVSDIEQKTKDLQNHKRESCNSLCHIGLHGIVRL